MRKAILSIALVSALSACGMTAQSHSDNVASNQSEASKPAYHTGAIEADVLMSQYPTFKLTHDENSQATESEIAYLAKGLDKKRMTVVFGTWCSDSQREVPRLLDLVNKVKKQNPQLDFDVELLAVAPFKLRDKSIIKKYQLNGVPSMILMDGEKEVGRVVEKTQISLAADFLNILN